MRSARAALNRPRKLDRRRCSAIGLSSRGRKPSTPSALIFSLVERVKRHVVFSDDEALTVVLWVMFAWVHDMAAVHSPILLATSAEANSGKTQLLSVINFLVPRALLCVEISEATLFRGIEQWRPTHHRRRGGRDPDQQRTAALGRQQLAGRAAPSSRVASATTTRRMRFRHFALRRSV